jgi:hypothetical protein
VAPVVAQVFWQTQLGLVPPSHFCKELQASVTVHTWQPAAFTWQACAALAEESHRWASGVGQGSSPRHGSCLLLPQAAVTAARIRSAARAPKGFFGLLMDWSSQKGLLAS